ncbi:DUF262 domain-containing protein [Bacillus pretiosus]|uniref:DUF262 domain-containing protein n=1 Tax=Bacillus pretiosus TaxID=2983392 RepID=UPI003D64CF7D
MKKLSINWTVKQFVKMVGKGTISFDYPIQREGEQWDLMQKSLLIHSLSADFPVPALYSIVEPKVLEEGKKPTNIYYILDGKQRLTNIGGFINGEYFLHEDTPSVKIDDEVYQIAGKTFAELEEEVKDAILSFSLQIYKLDEITDEEIEDLFFRLNNGTPLSKQQKAKAKMGTEWATKIQDLVNHDLMKNKASFTALQMRKADHETAVLQTMMLIDTDYKWKSISSNEVFEYSQTFKGDNSKDSVVAEVVKAMDYLNLAFEDKESVLLKKVHFPMTMLTALKAIEMEVHPMHFAKWRDEFKKSIKSKHKKDEEYIETDYKEFGGAGSVKKEKTLGRITEMQKHLTYYFENVHGADNVEEAKEEVAGTTEVVEAVEAKEEATEVKETGSKLQALLKETEKQKA